MPNVDPEMERLLTAAVLSSSVAEKVTDPREAALVAVLASGALNCRAGVALTDYLEVCKHAYEVFTAQPVEGLWKSMMEQGSESSL